jgi:hypothetical protein
LELAMDQSPRERSDIGSLKRFRIIRSQARQKVFSISELGPKT